MCAHGWRGAPILTSLLRKPRLGTRIPDPCIPPRAVYCVIRRARPTNSKLRVCRMTGIMISQNKKVFNPYGAPSGTRTLDPLIKSQLLYQLS